MPNCQPNTWAQMPTHLSSLVLLSFIYYPLEDRIQQIYQQKNPTKCSQASSSFTSVGTLMRWGKWTCPKNPRVTLIGVPPFLGTLPWTPVDYQWDLNLSSLALNSTSFLHLTALILHSIHLYLTLWYLLQPRKSSPAYLNKSQAFLLDLKSPLKEEKCTEQEIRWSLLYSLLVRPHWGNCSFWQGCSQRGLEKTVGRPEDKAQCCKGKNSYVSLQQDGFFQVLEGLSYWERVRLTLNSPRDLKSTQWLSWCFRTADNCFIREDIFTVNWVVQHWDILFGEVRALIVIRV